MTRKRESMRLPVSPQSCGGLSAQGESPWIDISVTLRDAMVRFPGNPPVRIERVRDIQDGASSSLSKISMGSHTGTHMDAPIHFLRQGDGIDQMPLDTAVGPARVIEISDSEAVKPGELRSHRIRRGERILFKTQNSLRAWRSEAFVEDYVFVSKEAARFLVGRGVRVVGVDYLSVGGFRRDGAETHQALLEAGVWIIEGLDLSGVEPGQYYLVCLPLKLENGDGAPARAILRPVAERREGRVGDIFRRHG